MMEERDNDVRHTNSDDFRRLPKPRRRWQAERNALFAGSVLTLVAGDCAAGVLADTRPGQVVLGALVVGVTLALRRQNAWLTLRDRILTLDATSSRDDLARLLALAEPHPPLQALASVRLAEWELTRGHTEQALRRFRELEARGWGEVSLDARQKAHIPGRLALLEALGECPERAPAWISVAERQGGRHAARMAQTVSWLRTGQAARAAAYLERRCEEAKDRYAPDEIALLWVLWAFALTRVENATYRRTESPRMQALVCAARPLAPVPLRWMSAHWPELREFAEAHKLL